MPLPMELDNFARGTINERLVLQFRFDCAQLLLDSRDLLFEALALGRAIDLNDEQNFAKRRRSDRSASSRLEFWIDD